MRRIPSLLGLLVLLGVPPRGAALAQLPAQAYELRNLGLARLENERPAEAEETYRRLLEIVPEEPLGWANLAIALLRQQEYSAASTAIDRALELAPGRGDLLAIRGEILLWSGEREEALATLERAHDASPENVEILYALYRHASSLRSTEAEAVSRRSISRLTELRPENLFVLLKQGQQAIARGDRSAASGAYLRIRELLWQAPEAAEAALQGVLEALASGDVASARVPAMRLENVLKITPMFKSSLGELFTNVQAMPVEHFAEEAPAVDFGDPTPIHFRSVLLDAQPTAGGALVATDLDNDDRPDLARIVGGPEPLLEVRLSGEPVRATILVPSPATGMLRAADLDNDGALDLVGAGERLAVWRGDGQGAFSEATRGFGLDDVPAAALTFFDYDIEGDLDVAVVLSPAGGLTLFRNSLAGPLEDVGDRALAGITLEGVRDVLASDPDRDGDLDLLVATPRGVRFLANQRQGLFSDRTEAAGLAVSTGAAALASCDLDNDGWPDLLAAGPGLEVWRNVEGRFERWETRGDRPRPEAGFDSVLCFDADNDGRLDVALSGDDGVVILAQPAPGVFLRVSVLEPPAAAHALAVADLDADGDLDLVAGGRGGLWRLENVGGNRNHWLAVRLRGLDQGNDKNNLFGIGATVELRDGDAYQYREATSPVTWFGLGNRECADLLRVTWTNGVPQNRIEPCRDQLVVEEQVLKGSCPFLYAETGSGIAFITDLLWGAPLGMPLGEGVWAGWDMEELVRVDGAAAPQGLYDLRITEELWEAAFFDTVRLWVVDHPPELEVASSLRIVPGERIEDRVLATAEVRELAAAWDGRGREVTERVRQRDEVYADGYPVGRYQGVTPRPWSFVIDLGEAPAAPVRLLLDGWIFPADASLNLAVAQREERPVSTRLEMETAAGWRVLLSKMGHPAGKTKTMVIDTPPLPPGVRRLRIVTSRWLHWDRIAWSLAPRDDEPRVVARLSPATAELRYRGFSRLERRAPNAPHVFDYDEVSAESPWLPFPGLYTRFGDVRELLLEPDDRHVILAPGDELALLFDARALPPPPPGWRRTVFLESHGWDKDADRNTGGGERLEPLPFRAMRSYPYSPGESYPDTPELDRYRDEWLVREVAPLEVPLPAR